MGFDKSHGGKIRVVVDAETAEEALTEVEKALPWKRAKPWLIEATTETEIEAERKAVEDVLYEPMEHYYRDIVTVECPLCHAEPRQRCMGAAKPFEVHRIRQIRHDEWERSRRQAS
jgi:hypothetical protein